MSVTLKYTRPDGTYVGDLAIGETVLPYHFIPEYADTWALAQAWLEAHPEPLPPEPPPPPPTPLVPPGPVSLTPRQAHAQLAASGRLEAFYQWLEAQSLMMRKAFEFADAHARDGSVLVAGLAALGLSDQDISAFFEAARAL